VRSTAAPYTESRLTHLVRNKCVGFPVVEQYIIHVVKTIFYKNLLYIGNWVSFLIDPSAWRPV
jgi:hypothetical protein